MKKAQQKHNMYLSTIKWVGTIFGIMAACAMAIYGFSNPEYQLMIFSWYTVGSMCWVVAGIWMKETSIITMNAIFLSINILAIIERL